MNVRKTDAFISDLERQAEWYALNASEEIARQYLDAVEASVQLLQKHPQLGPRGGFRHPRLQGWRFFVVLRPFSKHVLFYEIAGGEMVMRRATHGHRDLPRRLLES